MTSGTNSNLHDFEHLDGSPAGLNIAIPTLQTSRPTALEGESEVKNKVMKRTTWLMGASLVALALSGCLEGKNGTDGGGPTITSSSGLLSASNALPALYYPTGTKLSSVLSSPVQTELVYSKIIQVTTEDELAAALVVPAGDPPHDIVLKNTIVVERPLTVQGDSQIIGSQGEQSGETLHFVDHGGFAITNNNKPANQISQLRSCLSAAWQRLAYGSSLRIAVRIDGNVQFDGTASSFHLILTNNASGGEYTFANSDLRTMVAFDPGAYDVTYSFRISGLAYNDWLVSNSTYTLTQDAVRSVPDSHRMIVSPRPDIISTSYCQNLAADHPYLMNDYNAVLQQCSAGSWDDLAVSFNNCGAK